MLAGFQLDTNQAVTTTEIFDDGSNNGGLSLTGSVSDDLRTVTWGHTDSNAALTTEFNLVQLRSCWR